MDEDSSIVKEKKRKIPEHYDGTCLNLFKCNFVVGKRFFH